MNELNSLLENNNYKSRRVVFGAIICACVSALCIRLSAVCVQWLNRSVPDFELNAARNGFAWVVSVVVLIVIRKPPVLEGRDKILTVIYAALISVDTIGLYISVTFIPLATQESIMDTTNLFGGLILFWIFLKEKPTTEKVVAVILCGVGVFLVLQPDFIFSSHQLKTNNSTTAKM